MLTTQAKQTVFLDASKINKELSKHLHSKLSKELIGNCNQEYGYILEILPDITVIDNIITPSGAGAFFTVNFSLVSLLPKIDMILEGTVCLIDETCILIEIQNMMQIGIPSSAMKDYVFSKSKEQYKGKNQIIKMGDTVNVKITSIRYEGKKFDCVGRLKKTRSK